MARGLEAVVVSPQHPLRVGERRAQPAPQLVRELRFQHRAAQRSQSVGEPIRAHRAIAHLPCFLVGGGELIPQRIRYGHRILASQGASRSVRSAARRRSSALARSMAAKTSSVHGSAAAKVLLIVRIGKEGEAKEARRKQLKEQAAQTAAELAKLK